jgi:hypothetical protein
VKKAGQCSLCVRVNFAHLGKEISHGSHLCTQMNLPGGFAVARTKFVARLKVHFT